MIGIYVHLPFCLQKCPYCSFFSVSQAENKMEAYVESVIMESKNYPAQKVDTIYFGGGTPTSLPSPLLSTLLSKLLERFPCNGEITIESNPATATLESLSELHEAGFNRISIGVQSLWDEELKFLGRLHSAQDAVNAICDAKKAGFNNISADVIFGLPKQTKEHVSETVNRLISLPITHISTYSLSIEEGTPFSKQHMVLPDDESEREMYKTIIETLKNNNFIQYEISNFSMPGYASVHNTNYWKCGEYIGLGAGAHGCYQGVRYNNIANIDAYIMTPNPKENEIVLTDVDRREEYYMLGLRMMEGIKPDDNPNIPRLIENGLLERYGENIRLTSRGVDIANYVISELFV